MNIAQVIKGDPNKLKSSLTTLATTNTITVICKTNSDGSFVIVSDDAASASQVIVVLIGTPTDIVNSLNVLIAAGKTIQILEKTFSGGSYIAVYK